MSNKNTFKVVVDRVDFHVAPVSDTNRREAHASHDERGKLVRSLGLSADGSLPGLTEDAARKLRFCLSRARRRNKIRRRAG